MNHLTPLQAYQAMFYFLEDFYHQTEDDTIGGLLGFLSLLADGNSADPVMMEEWKEAVEKAQKNDISDINLKLKE